MNILIIDSDKEVLNILNQLTTIENDWNIFTSDGTLTQYKNHNIDFVLIDFSTNSNKILLDKIISINPTQKTITMSAILECSEAQGCNFCITTYNRRRLLKPIDIKSIYELIKNFEVLQCTYSSLNGFQNIEPIISDIIKNFFSYEYDKDSKTIRYQRNHSIHHITEMFEIIKILKEHNINYKIINDYDIKAIGI